MLIIVRILSISLKKSDHLLRGTFFKGTTSGRYSITLLLECPRPDTFEIIRKLRTNASEDIVIPILNRLFNAHRI
jgi:hypothetical protein